MFMLNKRVQKLIASGLALLFTLSAMCVMVWALLSTEQMGLSVIVSYTSPVTAKVYLATNSSTAVNGDNDCRQDSPTVDGEGGPTFDKAKSALIFNTYDSDTNGGLNKTAFEQLGAGTNNGLKCDANGEMEFYVYVENYSTTEKIFCNADVIFTEANGSEPFTVISNPMSITGTAIEAGTPTKSLLTFRIKSTNATGLNANTIRIEIDMNSLAVSSLQESSWATINFISEAGLASQLFSVGDEKNVLINGVNYTFQIWDFNHDDKSDDSGKAGITFGMKNLLAKTYNMNSSGKNSGGWEDSDMRSRMTNTFLTQLPPDLQSAIKTVNKLTTAGSTSTDIITSEDKLFLFSEREINGRAGTGYVGEGTRYAYWVGKGAADRIKRLSNGTGSPMGWWLRSPNISSNSLFRSFDGDSCDTGAGSAYGVCFGFCV